jgi:hypothetical protein
VAPKNPNFITLLYEAEKLVKKTEVDRCVSLYRTDVAKLWLKNARGSYGPLELA